MNKVLENENIVILNNTKLTESIHMNISNGLLSNIDITFSNTTFSTDWSGRYLRTSLAVIASPHYYQIRTPDQ